MMLRLSPLREVLDQPTQAGGVLQNVAQSKIAVTTQQISRLACSMIVICVQCLARYGAACCALSTLRCAFRFVLLHGESGESKPICRIDAISARDAVGASEAGNSATCKALSGGFAFGHPHSAELLGVPTTPRTNREPGQPFLSAVAALRGAMREFFGSPTFDARYARALPSDRCGLTAGAQAPSLICISAFLLVGAMSSVALDAHLSSGDSFSAAFGALGHGQHVARPVAYSKPNPEGRYMTDLPKEDE